MIVFVFSLGLTVVSSSKLVGVCAGTSIVGAMISGSICIVASIAACLASRRNSQPPPDAGVATNISPNADPPQFPDSSNNLLRLNILIALTAALSVFAVENVAATLHPVDPCLCSGARWSRFIGPKHAFVVAIPSPPVFSTQTNAFKGIALDYWTAEIAREVVFEVTHNKYPSPPGQIPREAFYEQLMTKMVSQEANAKATNVVSFSGVSGREIQFEKSDNLVVTVRVFLVDHDLYQAICIMPTNSICTVHRQRFLESFDVADSR